MNKRKVFTNFYTPFSRGNLKFEGGLPTVSEPDEDKSQNGENEDSAAFACMHYDLNKQNSEWLLLLEELGLNKYSAKDWFSELFEKPEDEKNWNFDIAYSRDLDKVKTSWIFDVRYQRMPIEDASEKHLVDKLQIKRWIKEFNKNLKIRALVNRKYLNKPKLLNQGHSEYLLKRWCYPFAKPYTLNELSGMLANEYKDLGRVSNSTISRVLRYELSMGYRKLSNINQKMKEKQEVSKLAKSALLLKRLEDADLELIFIDELKVSERSSKTYGWRLKGK